MEKRKMYVVTKNLMEVGEKREKLANVCFPRGIAAGYYRRCVSAGSW